MKRACTLAILAVFILAAPAVFAAAAKTPAVILAYFEDTSGVLGVKDDKGRALDPEVGMELKRGWQIVTAAGDYAELQLPHNGTIIKVSQKTTFRVDGLQSDADKGSVNAFTLSVGKIRTVAGKTTGKEQYRITTQSAVCGVRGTDFAMFSDLAENDSTYVFRGLVNLKSLLTGQEIEVGKGMMANALASLFQAVEIPGDLFQSLMDELDFKSLDMNTVPQLTAGGEGGTGEGGEGGQAPPPPMKSSFMDGVVAKLKEILGMEIGSVTIDDQTWAKVVVQPTFKVGKLKMGLYLPLIYQQDMFDPSKWYKPAGNNEWSFGTDQAGALNIVADVASDLFLKIKYVEWGNQRDPFFFKLGNLNDITVGHGLIMRNFANDADFPAVRRIGVNLGRGPEELGLRGHGERRRGDRRVRRQGVLPAHPQLQGGSRAFRARRHRPGAGLLRRGQREPDSGRQTPSSSTRAWTSTFPSWRARSSASCCSPTRRSCCRTSARRPRPWPASLPDSPGTRCTTPTDPVTVKNYGIAAGVFGNLVFPGLTYRLEFRDYTGAFKPQFYSTGYERERTSFVQDVLDYLSDTSAPEWNLTTMGIFGEGGFTLDKIFSLQLSYFWPWQVDPATGAVSTSDDDRFVAKFTLEKGVIPVVNIYGSVSYERTKFIPTILQRGAAAGLNLFDANTVVRAEVNYPAAPTLDVRILYTTTAKRDPVTGELVYTSSPLLPDMDHSIAIETSVHL